MTALFLQRLSTDICPPGSVTFQGGRRHKKKIKEGEDGVAGGEGRGAGGRVIWHHSDKHAHTLRDTVCVYTQRSKKIETARSTQP